MNTLAMSWSEWMAHDGVSLSGLVRSGQLTAKLPFLTQVRTYAKNWGCF